MHRSFYSLALAATLLLIGTVFASAQTPTDAHGGLAVVTNNPSDYWTICRKGVEAAQRQTPNVSVQFVMPDDGTVRTQKQDIDDLIAKGVKGIAVSPVDPANETEYLNGVAKKVALITMDSDAPQSDRLCYLGTDNHAAGLMAGRLIREALPHGGQIMLFVGLEKAQNARERIQGVWDALRGSQIRILGVLDDDADHARAKANVSDTLARYPHIAGLVGIWSYNGPAIASAVQDAHKAGRVKIVAFDQEEQTLDGVQSGVIYAAVAQQPYDFGVQSVKLLSRLVRGDRSGIPADRRIIVPTLAIKKATVAAYRADQARKLGGG
jgi:ribose transport system substrate-binding protein